MFVVKFTYISGEFNSFWITYESKSFKTAEDELDNAGLGGNCLKNTSNMFVYFFEYEYVIVVIINMYN